MNTGNFKYNPKARQGKENIFFWCTLDIYFVI